MKQGYSVLFKKPKKIILDTDIGDDIGPLTNIAMALKKSPEIKGMINEIVVMGGPLRSMNFITYGGGNYPHFIIHIFIRGLIVQSPISS